MSSLLAEMVNLSLQTQITRCKKKPLNDLMAGVTLETSSLQWALTSSGLGSSSIKAPTSLARLLGGGSVEEGVQLG